MDVKLISWRYKNIRGGLSEVEITLGNPPSRWTLIQMPMVWERPPPCIFSGPLFQVKSWNLTQ